MVTPRHTLSPDSVSIVDGDWPTSDGVPFAFQSKLRFEGVLPSRLDAHMVSVAAPPTDDAVSARANPGPGCMSCSSSSACHSWSPFGGA